ncbi:MAG: DUF4253 domain-containing protein [Silicimonas sp.]|nr:DUF4253 domain-containing protein [Silicimonas sp.]
MLALPFALRNVPVASATDAIRDLVREDPGHMPVLLGDADVFSAEWAESVDLFEDPEAILAEAATIDADQWFAARTPRIGPLTEPSDARQKLMNVAWRVGALPFDALLVPARLIRWSLERQRPAFLSKSPFSLADAEPVESISPIDSLRAQLAELALSGDGTDEELDEIRDVIEAIEADGTGPQMFPDPIDYVIPRHSQTVAAGLIETDAPWKSAAWLQHGTYALLAPKPVMVAHCRWLWEEFGARIITASTDHIGFDVAHPIETEDEAREVLARFFALCADEINAEHRGTDGTSLIGATRWWVWWD